MTDTAFWVEFIDGRDWAVHEVGAFAVYELANAVYELLIERFALILCTRVDRVAIILESSFRVIHRYGVTMEVSCINDASVRLVGHISVALRLAPGTEQPFAGFGWLVRLRFWTEKLHYSSRLVSSHHFRQRFCQICHHQRLDF